MTHKRTNPDFLNGVPELVILRLLSAQPMYGYELVQSIRRTTSQQLDFGEGCIYPILHRLEREGALSSRREPTGGRSRIVYCLTPKGEKRLAHSASTWKQLVGAVQLIMEGGGDARPSLA
jgi:PadR family transcriptional regulator PadR